MLSDDAGLRLKALFLQRGFEYQIAAKQYLGWHEQQQWQVRFLVRQGLKPGHTFLDIGCGWLRLAYALLPYLEPGRYFGLESEQVHLDIGQALFEPAHWQMKPTLLCARDFSFEKFETRFDVAFCHAVFTHLSHQQIRACVTKLKSVMKPDGVFFCTFYLAGRDAERPAVYRRGSGEDLVFTSSQVTLGFLRRLCRELALPMRSLGTQGHPTGHHVVEIRFDPQARRGAGLAHRAKGTARRLRLAAEMLLHG